MSSWSVNIRGRISFKVQISKLATFNLAFFSIPRQFAKLNSSPNFPAIRQPLTIASQIIYYLRRSEGYWGKPERAPHQRDCIARNVQVSSTRLFFFVGPSSHVHQPGYMNIHIWAQFLYEHSYCPRHNSVCHFKTREKKAMKYSLSLSPNPNPNYNTKS